MNAWNAFLASSAVLLLVGLGWVVWPLWRRTPTVASGDTDSTALAILREQLRDLAAERERGVIAPDLYEEARAELERRVVEEVQAEDAASMSALPARRNAGSDAEAKLRSPLARWTAIGLLVVVPLAASGLYAGLGDTAALAPRAPVDAQGAGFSPQQIEAMVDKLAQRLAQQPDDSRGWSVLARSYYALQRYPDAARAYERLLALDPNNADVITDYADTLGVIQERSLTGQPMQLIQRALAITPNHWKALALAGTDAFERKDYASAVTFWEKVKQAAPDSPIAQSIDNSIAEARQLGGLAAMTASLQSASGTPSKASASEMGTDKAVMAQGASSPKASEVRSNPGNTSAPGPGSTIGGLVTLAPELRSRVAPTDTVFVFARHAEGPRMPLAILKMQVKDLPARFVLDDSQAMSAQFRLSSANLVALGARVSKSGQAVPSSGDLEGRSGPLKLGTQNVTLKIDTVVP